jgi:hypothetical protein
MQTLQNLFDNIGDIVYCFVLTSLFYVPGLIYGLSGLKCAETSGGTDGGEDFRDLTMDDIKSHFQDIKKKRSIRAKLASGR